MNGNEGAMEREGAPQPSRLRLLVLCKTRMSTYRLPPAGEVTIGRDSSCDVYIPDESLAERHATLRVGPRLSLTDLGSGGSTTVGSEHLAPRATKPLAPGVLVSLGAVTLVVQSTAGSTRLRHVRSHAYFEARVEDECARVDQSGGGFVVARFACRRGAPSLVEEAITECLRAMDVVATYTPDEYEVLLVDCGRTKAREIVEDVHDRVSRGGGEIAVGWAHYPRDARTPEALFDCARASLRDDPTPASEILQAAPAVGAMTRLRPLVERVAAAQIGVLILGETGVGKEVMAKTIHGLSARAGKAMLTINCAAVSDTLLESELFGYERGAFTGATHAKLGLLETADGGTVFLDEVGEMPLTVQAKLLRVIEQKQVTRLGALAPRSIDVRFIAATNRDLEEEVERGTFRRDLYFRLNGFVLVIPPLRERLEEIDGLCETFISRACADSTRKHAPRVSPEARALLHAYAWPGNIRELRNVLERAVLLCLGDVIEPVHLPVEKMGRTLASVRPAADRSSRPESMPPPPSSDGAPFAIEDRERIVRALERCGGNQTKAAQILGVSRRTLIHRIEQYGLPRPKKP